MMSGGKVVLQDREREREEWDGQWLEGGRAYLEMKENVIGESGME